MSRSLSEIRRDLPGPPYVVAEAAVADILRAAKGAMTRVVEVEVPEEPTRRALLQKLGQALEFPEYFGANWDAWEDSLHGFGEESRGSWLVILRRCERLLASPPSLFAQVLFHLQRAQETVAQLGKGEVLVEFVFAGDWDRVLSGP